MSETQLEQIVKGLQGELATIRRTLQDIRAIQSPLLGIDQVASILGKSQDTVRRWVKDRTLSAYKVPTDKGFSYLFSMRQLEEDLADYLNEKL